LLRRDVLPHFARLNEELVKAGVPLVVLPGSEVQVTDVAVYHREFEAGLYCHLGDGRTFTLLEFNWIEDLSPPDAPALVAWLRMRGMTPIVAHPERHRFFADDPGRLRALVAAGAWLQITVDSLLGNHGRDPDASGAELLRVYSKAVLHRRPQPPALLRAVGWLYLGNPQWNQNSTSACSMTCCLWLVAPTKRPRRPS